MPSESSQPLLSESTPSLRYVSTRGDAPRLTFSDVLLAGLATDGGLYVPESWPSLPPLDELAHLPYELLAVEVMWPYIAGAWPKDTFAELVADAYASFDHPEVIPLVPLGDPDENLWLMELFWGPTLAFKDVALQLVGRLFDAELSQRNSQVTIIGATSGDTGSAAIEACKDKDTIDIFILHPHGRTTPSQRRQMTTVDSPTVHNIAIQGSFDDCQDIVKAVFGEAELRHRLQLSAVNSINWARVMAQIVYYVWALLKVRQALGGLTQLAFAVPTGNFGNVYAGHCAYRMGLAEGNADTKWADRKRAGANQADTRFIVGTNVNDSLNEFFETATLQTGQVTPTLSPSMDIMISSNLERLLFELHHRDATATTAFMKRLRQTGKASVDPEQLAEAAQIWSSWSCDDEVTLATMRQTYEQTGRLIDPHTAVGLKAAKSRRLKGEPTVVLATAHPAKFPDAVKAATGVTPQLPPNLADLHERPEYYDVLPNDLSAVREYVIQHSRLGRSE